MTECAQKAGEAPIDGLAITAIRAFARGDYAPLQFEGCGTHRPVAERPRGAGEPMRQHLDPRKGAVPHGGRGRLEAPGELGQGTTIIRQASGKRPVRVEEG